MRNFIFIIALVTSIISTVRGSHNFGGEMWYEYIGDSTGVPHQYIIYLRLYSDQAVVGHGHVGIASSCYPSTSVTLGRTAPMGYIQDSTGGYYLPEMRSCNDDSVSSFSYDLYVTHFQGTIILPGTCSDFQFSFHNCCLTSVDNLAGSSSINRTFAIGALLNNTLGPNSSPAFITAPITKFCNNIPQTTSHAGVEKDLDSIFYKSIDLQNYSSGYSSAQPMKTTTGFNLDSKSGTLSFTPSQTQAAILYFAAEEYRYDTVFATWFKIGQSARSIIYFTGNCQNLGQWNLAKSNNGIDSSLTPKCGEQKLTLSLEYPYNPSTLASDGSDFFILNSMGTPLPIISAIPIVDSASGLPKKVQLTLNSPLVYNDTYTLMSRTGTDMNTIISICGYQLTSKDTTRFIVSDCNTSIGIEEETPNYFNVYPSPANEWLNIEVGNQTNPSNLKIHNLTGQQMYSLSNFSKSFELNISSFPKGVYLITLESASGKTSTRKFIRH